MGTCLNICITGQFAARCCNIISISGFLFFAINYLLFSSQYELYRLQQNIPNPDNTRISMLITCIIYLIFVVITFHRIYKLNKQKSLNQKASNFVINPLQQLKQQQQIKPSVISNKQNLSSMMSKQRQS